MITDYYLQLLMIICYHWWLFVIIVKVYGNLLVQKVNNFVVKNTFFGVKSIIGNQGVS